MKWKVVAVWALMLMALGSMCSADAKGDLTKTMQALLAAKSYRIIDQTVLPGGQNTTSQMEFQAPDRYHMVTKNQSEVIVIGKEMYTKRDSKWMKINMPVNISIMIARVRNPEMLKMLANTTDAKFLGNDTVNGVPARLYQCTIAGGAAGSQANWITKVWVGPDDLPLKTEAHGETNGQAETTTQIYDYKTPVNIQPPPM